MFSFSRYKKTSQRVLTKHSELKWVVDLILFHTCHFQIINYFLIIINRPVNLSSPSCRSFIFSRASVLIPLCQAVLLHPWGPDRHPTIPPSHLPVNWQVFSFLLQTLFFINPHISAEKTRGKEREIKGLRQWERLERSGLQSFKKGTFYVWLYMDGTEPIMCSWFPSFIAFINRITINLICRFFLNIHPL